MIIKPLSPVSYLKNFKTQSQSVSQPLSNNNTNFFELPNHNVAFGARINIDKFKKKERDYDKYFVQDKYGFLPASFINAQELSNVCKELEDINPQLLIKLFTSTNETDGGVIAHEPEDDTLKVMNTFLLKLNNGKEILKNIYLKPDNAGNLPAHTFCTHNDIEYMCSVLDADTIAKIYSTKNNDGYKPSEESNIDDGDFAYIANLLKDNKSALNSIIFDNEKGEDYVSWVLYGDEDLKAFLTIYENEPELIRKYFISNNGKTENCPDKPCKEGLRDDIFKDVSAEFMRVLKNRLIDKDPALLKDIYTLTDSDGYLLTTLATVNNTDIHNVLAADMMELITNSDLNEKDSLEVLNQNYSFLQNRCSDVKGIDELPLIKKYLEEQIAKNS